MSEAVRCPVPACAGDDHQPRLAFRVVCPHHEAQAANDTKALSGMHHKLRLALADSRMPDVQVASSMGPTVPINLGVYTMLEVVEMHVRGYAELVKNLRNQPVGQVRYESALSYLVRSLSHLLGSRYAVEYVVNTHRLHLAIRRTLNLTVLVHRLPAPCPSCDLLTLTRIDGADEVACESCHTKWTEIDYNRLVRVLAWQHRP